MSTGRGVSVSFMSYGGTNAGVRTLDRNGLPGHVAFGFPTLRDCETVNVEEEPNFGALIGLHASWIDKGRFRLDGRDYAIKFTSPPNAIHGGRRGIDRRTEPEATSGPSAAERLGYASPDGEEGFPGTLRIDVTYSLSEAGALWIRSAATTDRATVVNLSSYMTFDLAGAGSSGTALDRLPRVDADRNMPSDRSQTTPGRPARRGTPFDFRMPTTIEARRHDVNAHRISMPIDEISISPCR